jgi:hypothetical protein
MSCTAGGSVTELVLADGPARYLGGSIETFALRYGAFIATGVPGLHPPHVSETLQDPDVLSETEFTHPAAEAEGDE